MFYLNCKIVRTCDLFHYLTKNRRAISASVNTSIVIGLLHLVLQSEVQRPRKLCQ